TQPIIFSKDLSSDNPYYIFYDQPKGIQQVFHEYKLWPSGGFRLKYENNYYDQSDEKKDNKEIVDNIKVLIEEEQLNRACKPHGIEKSRRPIRGTVKVDNVNERYEAGYEVKKNIDKGVKKTQNSGQTEIEIKKDKNEACFNSSKSSESTKVKYDREMRISKVDNRPFGIVKKATITSCTSGLDDLDKEHE
ncbi:11308_t:CDS:2, partial [Gigaspora margarita]